MSRARDLTLVEVVFATALLAILLMGLFASLGASRRAELYSREHQAASDAVFRTLDEQAARPFDNLLSTLRDDSTDPPTYAASLTGAFPVPYGRGDTTLPPADDGAFGITRHTDDSGTAADESAMAGRYTLRIPDATLYPQVEFDGDADVPDLIEIEVVVAWKGSDGANNQVSMTRRKVRP